MTADLQLMGRVSALVMVATFVVGIVVFLGVLMPASYFAEDVEGARRWPSSLTASSSRPRRM